MNIFALIPARGGSKSIPKKNITLLNDKPLIAYSIEVANRSRHIARTIVSTDCTEIKDISLKLGAEVPFLRPAEYARDDTPDLPVFEHALRWLQDEEQYFPDIVVHLRPTTPLRTVEQVDNAIEALLANSQADSLRSVSRPLQNPYKMWTLSGEYLNPLMETDIPEPYNQPRQQLPTVYWHNGFIDVIRTQTILQKNSMTGDKIAPYVMDNPFVIDIDLKLSLKIAEILLKDGNF